jgi:hypothetical protein
VTIIIIGAYGASTGHLLAGPKLEFPGSRCLSPLSTKYKLAIKHMKRFVAPCADWESAGYLVPFIDHSCCAKHVNCEYVSTDKNENGLCSVGVRN